MVLTNPMPHEALLGTLGGSAYPLGGYGTFVPDMRESRKIPTASTARLSMCTFSLASSLTTISTYPRGLAHRSLAIMQISGRKGRPWRPVSSVSTVAG